MENFLQIGSIGQAIDSGGRNLYGIRKELGEAKTAAVIMLYLIELDNTMHLKYRLNDEQVKFTARAIMENYPFLNMGDIKLVMDRIKMGKCGKAYERLDQQYIMIHFEDYAEDRIRESEERRMKEKEEQKNELMQTNTRDYEFVKMFYKKSKMSGEQREKKEAELARAKEEQKRVADELQAEDEIRRLRLRIQRLEEESKERTKMYQKALSDAETREKHTQWALDFAAEKLGTTSYQLRKEEKEWRDQLRERVRKSK